MKSLIAYVFVALIGYAALTRVPAGGQSLDYVSPRELLELSRSGTPYQVKGPRDAEDSSRKKLNLKAFSVDSMVKSPVTSTHPSQGSSKMKNEADCLHKEVMQLKEALEERKHGRAKRKASRRVD